MSILGQVFSFPEATDTSLKLEYFFQPYSATQTIEWWQSTRTGTQQMWISFSSRERWDSTPIPSDKLNFRREETSTHLGLGYLPPHRKGRMLKWQGWGRRKELWKTRSAIGESRLATLGLARTETFGPFSPDQSLTLRRFLLSDPHCTDCCPPQILRNACLAPRANSPWLLRFAHTLDAVTWSNPCSLQVKGSVITKVPQELREQFPLPAPTSAQKLGQRPQIRCSSPLMGSCCLRH